MSTSSSYIDCPQCGYAKADHVLDCRSFDEQTMCRRCGYEETWEPKYCNDGQPCGWKHEISKGFGALWYRSAGGHAFVAHYLHSPQEVADAECGLREAFNNGQVDRQVSYVTSWNSENKQVELLIGEFYEWPEPDWEEFQHDVTDGSQPIC
jgi:hypothetical protein